jgi:hypothetical protein
VARLLTWPLSALFVWGGAWLLFGALWSGGMSGPLAATMGSALGALLSVIGSTRARRLALACGFPLSLVLTEIATLPLWIWAALLVFALLLYPVRSWRDAPLFPTPEHALRDIPQFAPLPAGAVFLDAGCGLGDGLLALRQAYPQGRYFGIEASWPLRIMAAFRCPWASIRHGDIWQEDWHGYALVYLFQRPEAMRRAVAKAHAELQRGAWLVSLEFEAEELLPTAVAYASPGRAVWMYQQPFQFVVTGGRSRNHPLTLPGCARGPLPLARATLSTA